MANQCEQLARLLTAEGLSIELVRTNAPYRPAPIGRIPIVRAFFRLVPFARDIWRAAGRSQVMHILANSGWAWHLIAAPAIFAARQRRIPVIVNYRGGGAEGFFASAPRAVMNSLRKVQLRVTPSGYLKRIFSKFDLDAEVIPNIIDLSRFSTHAERNFGLAPNLLVARNLESIYDIPTALRAFAHIRSRFPEATLTIAGIGPELAHLRALAVTLDVAGAVEFVGRVDNAAMPGLYMRADCTLNPSTVDNMPISILEAYASGVPVVSTDAGGVPDVVENGASGLLVPVGDDLAMASATCRLLEDHDLRQQLIAGGLAEAKKYSWPCVKPLWLDAYMRAAKAGGE
jgi:glycosyltransferase involved in cell wall biosynthesis